MRRTAIYLILLSIMMSACGDTDRVAAVEPNASASGLQEITMVGPHGTPGDSLVEVWATVSSDLSIEVEIMTLAGNPNGLEPCTSASELDMMEYQRVVTAVTAADLMNYEPPDPASCETVDGKTGIDVFYEDISGANVSFSTGSCELDPEIADLADLFGELAMQYAPECFTKGRDRGKDPGFKDPDDDTGPVVYDVPVYIPRRLPRPMKP